MSVIYNEEKKQHIYQAKQIVTDSDSDSDFSESPQEETESLHEVITIDHQADTILSKNVSHWQRLIGDYTITDMGEIIEQLIIMSNDKPDDETLSKALIEARDYQFQKSIADRKKILVKKDLNNDQFGTRIKENYDRSNPDQQYKIFKEGQERGQEELNKPRPAAKPAPKNWKTKRLPVMSNTKPTNSPDDWLKS
jgi:hypothetical protein